jgi:hypothetical protein
VSVHGAWRQERAVIHRLRAVGSGLDPLSTRLGLEGLLASAPLHPRRLPSEALLCVRRLGDPRPRTVRTGRHAARLPPAWALALEASLERLAAAAARPALGPVPASAEAVLFADEAELLACLARDVGSGEGGARWWWQVLYGGRDLQRVLVEAWVDAPELLAPVLERLTAASAVVPVLRRLGPAVAQALGLALARRHGLRAVVASLEAAPAAPAAAPDPFRTAAPEVASMSVGVEERTLVGLALLLRRAPALLRAGPFAEGLSAWRAATAAGAARPQDGAPAGRRVTPGTAGSPRSIPSAPPLAVDPPAGHATSIAALAPGDQEGLQAPLPGPVEPSAEDGPPRAERGAPPRAAPTEPRAPAAPANALETSAEARPAVVPEPPPLAPALLETPVPRQQASAAASPMVAQSEPVPAPLQVVETGLGGLFYLVNVGLFLGLYPDFTRPLEHGLDLSIWDFVALLGRELLEEPSPDDPIWRLLARLADRAPADAPGEGFSPPDAWRLPPAWLAPLPDPRPCRWSCDGERLRLEHPAGFLVVDVALVGDAAALAAREGSPYAMPTTGPASARPPAMVAGSAQERWAARLAGYLRARLARALLLEPPAAVALLLRAPARIVVDETRIEVQLSLERHPLQVRLAGLDRDPGWLPSGGRSLCFRYG